ncbi:LysR substrate-binding domain-containing protein [Escherichia coli]|nr:LysR substrate-binding domain-containing protein [Escherichia coli]
MVPRLSSFNSAYPGIDVRIRAVDRQEDKLADDVDVAIFYGRGNWYRGYGWKNCTLNIYCRCARRYC